ncbi:chemotaxis protein CheW [Sphingomonas sp. MMS24-JH45]
MNGVMNRALHLVADIGDCGVLIDAARVDLVVDIDATYPAPGAAPAILGLAAMSAAGVATVVDARRLLGLPAAHGEGGARAVVTAVGGHLYAIAVDTLEDVACFDSPRAPPASVASATSSAAWRRATAKPCSCSISID